MKRESESEEDGEVVCEWERNNLDVGSKVVDTSWVTSLLEVIVEPSQQYLLAIKFHEIMHFAHHRAYPDEKDPGQFWSEILANRPI